MNILSDKNDGLTLSNDTKMTCLQVELINFTGQQQQQHQQQPQQVQQPQLSQSESNDEVSNCKSSSKICSSHSFGNNNNNSSASVKSNTVNINDKNLSSTWTVQGKPSSPSEFFKLSLMGSHINVSINIIIFIIKVSIHICRFS